MTDLSAYLDAAQGRADAATPGPWEWNGVTVSGPSRYATTWVVVDYGTAIADEPEAFDSIVADAAFIAAARIDVPAMVAVLREIERLCEQAEGLDKSYPRLVSPILIRAAMSSLTPDTPRSET